MPRTYQALGYHGEAMTPPLPFDVGLVMQVQQRVLPGRSLMELLAARGRLGALLRHTRRCGRCGAGICATAACLAKDVLGRPRCRKRKPR